MEPVITIVLNPDYTPVEDWTREELRWLIDHMDWSVETLKGGYKVVYFYIPVTRNN